MKTYHQQSSRLPFLKYLCGAFIINVVLILSTGVATAVNGDPNVENNHYDARIVFNQGFTSKFNPTATNRYLKDGYESPGFGFYFRQCLRGH